MQISEASFYFLPHNSKCIPQDPILQQLPTMHNLSILSPGATQPIVGVYFTALYRAIASSRTRLLDHTATRHSR